MQLCGWLKKKEKGETGSPSPGPGKGESAGSNGRESSGCDKDQREKLGNAGKKRGSEGSGNIGGIQAKREKKYREGGRLKAKAFQGTTNVWFQKHLGLEKWGKGHRQKRESGPTIQSRKANAVFCGGGVQGGERARGRVSRECKV